MKEINAPVVPVYIDGAFEAWPRFNKFPKLHKIKIRLGKMVTLKDLLLKGADSDVDIYKTLAKSLRTKVLELKDT